MILDNWSQPGDFESWFSVPVLFGEMQFESVQTSLMVSWFRNSSCFKKKWALKKEKYPSTPEMLSVALRV